MNMLLLNILLALAWMMLTGNFMPVNFLLGFGTTYLLLRFCQPVVAPSSRYPAKLQAAVAFVLFFLRELIKANFKVAYDLVTPQDLIKPGVIAVPLDARTDAEITLLANLITLTPGTLSLDLSTDRRVLYVHAMYIADADSLRRGIKEGFERRVLELLR